MGATLKCASDRYARIAGNIRSKKSLADCWKRSSVTPVFKPGHRVMGSKLSKKQKTYPSESSTLDQLLNELEESEAAAADVALPSRSAEDLSKVPVWQRSEYSKCRRHLEPVVEAGEQQNLYEPTPAPDEPLQTMIQVVRS